MTPAGRAFAAVSLLSLLSGAALGSWGQRVVLHRRQRAETFDAQRALEHLDHELGLDARQKEAVKKILLARQQEAAAMEKDRHHRIADERRAARAEIVRELTPEQRPKFQALCDRADKRIQERWPDEK